MSNQSKADKKYETKKQISEISGFTLISVSNDNGNTHSKHTGIIMSNATAKWTDGQIKNSIENINLTIKPGWLLAIVGPVGAGKVYILMQ